MRIFSEFFSIIKDHVFEGQKRNIVIFEKMFKSCIGGKSAYAPDESSISRMVNDEIDLSPHITRFYLSDKKKMMRDNPAGTTLLEQDMNNVYSLMEDKENCSVAMRMIDAAIEGGLIPAIQEDEWKKILNNPERSKRDNSVKVLADVLYIIMLEQSSVDDKIIYSEVKLHNGKTHLNETIVPDVCPYFCGRETELIKLQNKLKDYSIVFVEGILGIGTSELAYKYVKMNRDQYENIVYLNYGNLRQAIMELFTNSSIRYKTIEERFNDNLKLLCKLDDRNLILLDDCNKTVDEDNVLKYIVSNAKSKIIVTTSCKTDYPKVEVHELHPDELLDVVKYFYDVTDDMVVLKIIYVLHKHTFAVELAARLLRWNKVKTAKKWLIRGPKDLYNRIKREKIKMEKNAAINLKQRNRGNHSYYDHIRLLYKLFELSERQKYIMRMMYLTPISSGIGKNEFSEMMDVPDMHETEELIEHGFLKEVNKIVVKMHGLIKDVTEADLEAPSITQCEPLIEYIKRICQRANNVDEQYRMILYLANSIAKNAKKDDYRMYRELLQDVIPYMDKFKSVDYMDFFLSQLEEIIEAEDKNGKENWHSIIRYYDSQAVREVDVKKRIEEQSKAVELVDAGLCRNKSLESNVLANMAKYYHENFELTKAFFYNKRAMKILEDNLPEEELMKNEDYLVQVMSHATILADCFQFDAAFEILENVDKKIAGYKSSNSEISAKIQEQKGYIYLLMGDNKMAEQHFRVALSRYRYLYRYDDKTFIEALESIIDTCKENGIKINIKDYYLE